ncbi:hypothetical protein ACVW1B_004344 [Bradyrhizobium sp. USDA 4502]
MTQMVQRDDVLGFAPTHSADSSAREKLVEHLFLGELLRTHTTRAARLTHARGSRERYDGVG